VKHFILLILLSAFFFSCKKDKDELEPSVTIYSPYLNQSFQVPDTIQVNIKVSDETKLTSVTVVLQDMNNVNAGYAVPVAIQSNSFQFQLDYILDDQHLSTGDYKLAVIASDGSNTEVAGRVIHVTAVPLHTRFFYFATETGSSTVVTRYDSVFTSPQLLNFNDKFLSLEASSWYQRLYIAGEVNAPFNAYSVANHQQNWTLADLGAGFPYFSSLSGDDKRIVLGYFDGRLTQYDFTGNATVNYQTGSSSYYPAFSFQSGNSCYVGMHDNLSAAKEFRRFDRNTGVQLNQYGVPWEVKGMGDKASGEVYVAGNTNSGQAVLNIYYNSTNSFYSPLILPSGTVNCGVGVNGDYFLIAHSNGTLYRYQYSTNSLLSVMPAVNASKMIYNGELNELYLSSGNVFFIYNVLPFSLQLKQSFVHSGNIDDFEVVLNR
jgi:hypothetical protein